MYTHIPVTVMKAGLAFHVKMVKAVIIITLMSFFKWHYSINQICWSVIPIMEAASRFAQSFQVDLTVPAGLVLQSQRRTTLLVMVLHFAECLDMKTK